MTDRFTETISTGIVKDNQTGKEYNCKYRINDDFLKLVNIIADENEQLKNFSFKWKQNRVDFDKDELYFKDNNIEFFLKNRDIIISVFIPKIKEHFCFHYTITGRILEYDKNLLNSFRFFEGNEK